VTEAGDVIAGRYRLEARVGRGAMGEVWRARDERLDRDVAVKLLRPDAAADELTVEEADRLGRREGRVAARVRHPHAVMVHDTVEHEGRPCLVMEHFPARSLSALIDANGPMPPDEVAAIGEQLASALAAAHAEGVVHRDVKPGNVLVAADGTAKIADFGISQALGDGTQTGTGIVAGTPAYLSPEVARGEPATFASDVFSLGATLYTAQEGHPPYGYDDNPIALLQRVAHGTITLPSRPGPLTGVLLWMLRDKPGERPLMSEVHEALAAIGAGQPLAWPAPPATLNPTLVLAARRSSRRAIMAAATAALLVAAGVTIGLLINEEPTAGTGSGPGSNPVPTTTATPPGGCVASARLNNSWPGGYQIAVTVRNDGDRELVGWTAAWTMPPGHRIDNLWQGNHVQDGTSVVVRDAGYNANVDAGASTEFGFNAAAPDDADPPDLAVTCASR
jgi:serine/threonine protein kinase